MIHATYTQTLDFNYTDLLFHPITTVMKYFCISFFVVSQSLFLRSFPICNSEYILRRLKRK